MRIAASLVMLLACLMVGASSAWSQLPGGVPVVPSIEPAPTEPPSEGLLAAPPVLDATPSVTLGSEGPSFAASSPWNMQIPSSPALDPNSAAMAGYLGGEMRGYADLY